MGGLVLGWWHIYVDEVEGPEDVGDDGFCLKEHGVLLLNLGVKSSTLWVESQGEKGCVTGCVKNKLVTQMEVLRREGVRGFCVTASTPYIEE